MYPMEYDRYLDKVYGCWLGKCIAGTIGAPYEGMKELLEMEFAPALIENMLPNDDLDLQILWLGVLEEKGIDITSEDLARAFFMRCPYAPGEYAVFKKNYARGIRAPVCGWFNNRYYIEGMGSPIRSEIWGCIAPANPSLAARYAALDAVLDHAGNSVYAEQFLAAVEAAAFVESDIDALVQTGLGLIPEDSRMARLIRDVRQWCRPGADWRYVRSRVIRDYGHPDCTNLFQNIGFTLLALYLGGGDFIKTVMMALNCGFDTDCSCATAGAIIGIVQGGRRLEREHGFTDQGYILGVDAPRRSDRLTDLAEDTCRIGLLFAEQANDAVRITGAPDAPRIPCAVSAPVGMEVEYDGVPAIGVDDSRRLGILLENRTGSALRGKVRVDVPPGWGVEAPSGDVTIGPGAAVTVQAVVRVPRDIALLHETNICRASFQSDAGHSAEHEFGLVGAAVWQVFGPFWQNNIAMPRLQAGESYYGYIGGSDLNDAADRGRTYHLNTRVELNREYMAFGDLLAGGDSSDAAKEPAIVNCYEDLINTSELIGFQGPCAVYMVRRLVSPEDRKVGLLIGHTDAFRLWINGELVSERDNVDWWTAENVHIHDYPIRNGENVIVVRLSRRTGSAGFSLVFTTRGSCSDHYHDFASANPVMQTQCL